MEVQLTENNLISNLKDAGCCDELINQFIQYYYHKDLKNQLLLLKCYRCNLKEDIHVVQKKIDCLDYLIYLLKKEETKSEK